MLTFDRVRALLAGRVPEEEAEERAGSCSTPPSLKRLAEHASVVVGVAGVVAPRSVSASSAWPPRSGVPRHLILIEAGREQVAEEDRATLNDLRRRLDAGELGAEGFQTVMRLGGATVAEVKRILFRPPPADD